MMSEKIIEMRQKVQYLFGKADKKDKPVIIEPGPMINQDQVKATADEVLKRMPPLILATLEESRMDDTIRSNAKRLTAMDNPDHVNRANKLKPSNLWGLIKGVGACITSMYNELLRQGLSSKLGHATTRKEMQTLKHAVDVLTVLRRDDIAEFKYLRADIHGVKEDVREVVDLLLAPSDHQQPTPTATPTEPPTVAPVVKRVTAKNAMKKRRLYGATSRVPTRTLTFKEVMVLKRLLVAGYAETWIASHLNISVAKVFKIGYGGSYSRVLPHLNDLTLAACAPLVCTPKISDERLKKFVRIARTTHHKIIMTRTDMVVFKGMVAAGSTNTELAMVFDLPCKPMHNRIVCTAMQEIGADCETLNGPYRKLAYGEERIRLERMRIARHELGQKVTQ